MEQIFDCFMGKTPFRYLFGQNSALFFCAKTLILIKLHCTCLYTVTCICSRFCFPAATWCRSSEVLILFVRSRKWSMSTGWWWTMKALLSPSCSLSLKGDLNMVKSLEKLPHFSPNPHMLMFQLTLTLSVLDHDDPTHTQSAKHKTSSWTFFSNSSHIILVRQTHTWFIYRFLFLNFPPTDSKPAPSGWHVQVDDVIERYPVQKVSKKELNLF